MLYSSGITKRGTVKINTMKTKVFSLTIALSLLLLGNIPTIYAQSNKRMGPGIDGPKMPKNPIIKRIPQLGLPNPLEFLNENLKLLHR